MRKLTTGKWSLSRHGALVLLCSALLAPATSWALTAANTLIRNQASATFKDESGISYNVTSNVVETLVQQVAGLELTQDQSKLANRDSTVEFNHVITNTGNGDDSYQLSLTQPISDNFDFTAVKFYADANQDGQADNLNAPITQTPVLKAGESFAFVAIANTPSALAIAPDGSQAQLTVSASSQFTPTSTVSNTDSALITKQSVIVVTKSMSATSGVSGSSDKYTITLSYRNTSTVDANYVMLVDKLPAGMTYVPNSGRWSEGGGLVLTDADMDVQDNPSQQQYSIYYCAYDSSCAGLPLESTLDPDTDTSNQVFAAPLQINAGMSGQVTFEVTIDPNLPVSTLTNTAEYLLDAATTTIYYTNPVKFKVEAAYGVVTNGSSTSDVNNTNEPITLASAVQGQSITFYDYVWNTGNATDTFDLSLVGNTFPNTAFQLLQADGYTPILDTDGDGKPDTGPLAPGEHYVVALKSVLPASAKGDNAGAGYQVTLQATSSGDTTIMDPAINQLLTITPKTVDLTNNQPINTAAPNTAPGEGVGPEASAVTTNAVQPGTTTQFSLYVNNLGATDNYDLQVSTDSTFNTIVLPPDWKVTFSTPTDNDLANTGSVVANAPKEITATVSVPANATPQTVELYFRIMSPNTGASDIKHDAVVVGVASDLVLYPDNTGQVLPGGMIVYSHWLSNQGNDTKTNITFQNTDDKTDWTSMLYEDTDGNGVLSPNDQYLTSIASLAVDETILIFNKVQAAATIPMGQTNTTTIKALWDGGASSLQVVDVTTTNSSDVSIRKEQSLDANCNGTSDTGSFSADNFHASPGQCIIYRLTATNTGAEQVQNVKIQDATPAYTVFNTVGGLPVMSQGALASPITNGSTGNIIGVVGTLDAGDTASLTFGIKIK